jgi:hypothetical protein
VHHEPSQRRLRRTPFVCHKFNGLNLQPYRSHQLQCITLLQHPWSE